MATNVGNPAQSCPLKQTEYLPPQQQEPKKHFINFKLVDDKGKPMENVQLLVTLPDGSTEEATTDKNGMIEIANVQPGSCKIAFDWKEATTDNFVFFT